MRVRATLIVLCTILALDSVVALTQVLENNKAQNLWEGKIIKKEKHAVLNVSPKYPVTVTIYHATPDQTDSTPHILASGIHIDIPRAGDYRYCALSRDLLKRWGGPFNYGDVIMIEGIDNPDLNGAWIIQDTMNARWTNRVDLLVDTSLTLGKYSAMLSSAE